METYLFERAEYERLYNCSWYSVEAVPLEVRRSPWLGYGFIALSVLYTLCYIPCAVAICRHLQHSCYKMMFSLACCDIAALVNAGPYCGYVAITGSVFCSMPTLMPVNCVILYLFWLWETSLAVLLAFNRCLTLLAPNLGELLFDGWRVWIWLLLSMSYSVIGVFFAPGCGFTAILFAHTHNPHAGYYHEWYKDEAYHSSLQTLHNLGVLVALSLLYTVLFIGLLWKGCHEWAIKGSTKADNGNSSSGNLAWQRRVFVQVVVVSTVNGIAAALFVALSHIVVPPWLIYVGTYCYLSVHGLPGIIYLIFNKTIRSDCREMFTAISTKMRVSTINTVHPATTGQVGIVAIT